MVINRLAYITFISSLADSKKTECQASEAKDKEVITGRILEGKKLGRMIHTLEAVAGQVRQRCIGQGVWARIILTSQLRSQMLHSNIFTRKQFQDSPTHTHTVPPFFFLVNGMLETDLEMEIINFHQLETEGARQNGIRNLWVQISFLTGYMYSREKIRQYSNLETTQFPPVTGRATLVRSWYNCHIFCCP